jgi:hypothetical protein
MSRVHVEIGAQHYDLTVLEYVTYNRGIKNLSALRCQCACGNETVVVLYDWGKRRVSCGECKGGAFHDGKRTVFGLSTYFAGAKLNAKKRGIDFSLSIQDYANLISKPCHYCGADHVGLDRVDSDLGYHQTNVVPCCYRCNKAKSNSSYKEFKEWMQKLSAHYAATKWKTRYVFTAQRLFQESEHFNG